MNHKQIKKARLALTHAGTPEDHNQLCSRLASRLTNDIETSGSKRARSKKIIVAAWSVGAPNTFLWTCPSAQYRATSTTVGSIACPAFSRCCLKWDLPQWVQ